MKYYAGRKFWEFISGEEGCRDEILEIISETAANFQDMDNNSILSITNKKINYIEEELCDKYGKDEKNRYRIQSNTKRYTQSSKQNPNSSLYGKFGETISIPKLATHSMRPQTPPPAEPETKLKNNKKVKK